MGEDRDSAGEPRRRWTPLSFADFLRLLIACTAVGMAMRLFGLTPGELWGGAADAVSSGVSDIAGAFGPAMRWARDYILLGASVVIPIWLIFKLLGAAARKR
ncbi:MAG: DUF6460 domain-containing protein [Caulobacterales bacterium]|nr:DUF6460 domain-containing protein [Caulobacterales bacterium]